MQNPKIKELGLLQQKARHRVQSGRFVVEGARELEACCNAGYKIETLFFCPQIYSGKANTAQEVAKRFNCSAAKVFTVSEQLYSKIAYRSTTEGVIAEVAARSLTLADVERQLPETPLIIVAEGIEKPGNIGALLRTSDACGADEEVVFPRGIYLTGALRLHSDMKVCLEDGAVLQEASVDAEEVLRADPALQLPENKGLRFRLSQYVEKRATL